MNLLAVLDSGYIKKEPYGVVLILGKLQITVRFLYYL